MAKLSIDDQEIEIPDNKSLFPEAEVLGIYFGCQDGDCGVCEVEIVEGYENLSAMTDKEREFNLLKNHRLLCQCRIKHGNVKIKF